MYQNFLTASIIKSLQKTRGIGKKKYLSQVFSKKLRTRNKELKSKGNENKRKNKKSALTEKGQEGNALGKGNRD
jgi:hypothetical protein